MPSPFPGMDPYLEGELWTTVHAQLAAEIARQLALKVAPRYIARTEKRFMVLAASDAEEMELAIYTDIGVRSALTATKMAPAQPWAMQQAPLVLATVLEEKVPHFWVEIRDAKKRKLVTAIEILSPFNKRGRGREEYLAKRQAVLGSPAHFLEIDLLRKGKRLPMRKRLPSADYFVFLSRARRRPLTEIWPVQLADSLPKVPVPLLKGDEDVPLELQQALTNVYDLCRYDLEVDYAKSPDVPLPKNLAAWADNLLRAAGKRP